MEQHAGAEAVAARLREAWSRPGAVTAGFRLRSAEADEGAVRVEFDWRRDPQRYVVRLPFPGLVREALGDAFTADEAATELTLWLMEELDTGFVARAGRTRLDDVVLLEERVPPPSGWFVGDVPLARPGAEEERAAEAMRRTGLAFAVVIGGEDDLQAIADPGRHLDHDGLDGAAGRAAVRGGDLIAWLQLDRGDLGSPRVEQAVVTRVDATTARLAVLELRTSDPAAAEALVLAACRRAVEAGAERIEAPRALGLLRAYGFHDAGAGLAARHDEVHRPVPCGRSGAPA